MFYKVNEGQRVVMGGKIYFCRFISRIIGGICCLQNVNDNEKYLGNNSVKQLRRDLGKINIYNSR